LPNLAEGDRLMVMHARLLLPVNMLEEPCTPHGGRVYVPNLVQIGP